MLKVEIQSALPEANLICSGRIVLGVEAETLRCMATSTAAQQLVINLSEVRAIDAAGLGLLIELHHWAQQRHATLIIERPSARMQRLLALTQLDRVLQVRGSGLLQSPEYSEEWRTMTA
jgi:anti-anti-sigma factor